MQTVDLTVPGAFGRRPMRRNPMNAGNIETAQQGSCRCCRKDNTFGAQLRTDPEGFYCEPVVKQQSKSLVKQLSTEEELYSMQKKRQQRRKKKLSELNKLIPSDDSRGSRIPEVDVSNGIASIKPKAPLLKEPVNPLIIEPLSPKQKRGTQPRLQQQQRSLRRRRYPNQLSSLNSIQMPRSASVPNSNLIPTTAVAPSPTPTVNPLRKLMSPITPAPTHEDTPIPKFDNNEWLSEQAPSCPNACCNHNSLKSESSCSRSSKNHTRVYPSPVPLNPSPVPLNPSPVPSTCNDANCSDDGCGGNNESSPLLPTATRSECQDAKCREHSCSDKHHFDSRFLSEDVVKKLDARPINAYGHIPHKQATSVQTGRWASIKNMIRENWANFRKSNPATATGCTSCQQGGVAVAAGSDEAAVNSGENSNVVHQLIEPTAVGKTLHSAEKAPGIMQGLSVVSAVAKWLPPVGLLITSGMLYETKKEQ